jgi:hypothetical protein
MHPRLAVPLSEAPNHRARSLFFALLDREWPALKESLIEQVWPVYRTCWRESIDGFKDPPAHGMVRIKFPSVDDRVFVAPQAVWSWSKLQNSETCVELRRAVAAWGLTAGRGLRDGWLLESALVTLRNYPLQQTLCSRGFFWEYAHPGPRAYEAFAPSFRGPKLNAVWLPDDEYEYHFGTWKQFQQRMRNHFERELSRYHKNMMAQWGLRKGNHRSYAQWTIARLSGLTWAQVVKRYPMLERYSDGEAQAKKRVREFSSEIGLTL